MSIVMLRNDTVSIKVLYKFLKKLAPVTFLPRALLGVEGKLVKSTLSALKE